MEEINLTATDAIFNFTKINDDELNRISERVRQRKIESRKALLTLFVRAISSFNDRVGRFLTEPEMEIEWRRLFREEEWTRDETLALQWLRSLWDEKMYVRTCENGGLFPENWELRQTVFLALAEAHHLSHMIDEYFRKSSFPTSELSA